MVHRHVRIIPGLTGFATGGRLFPGRIRRRIPSPTYTAPGSPPIARHTMTTDIVLYWLPFIACVSIVVFGAYYAWKALYADRAKGRRRCPRC